MRRSKTTDVLVQGVSNSIKKFESRYTGLAGYVNQVNDKRDEAEANYLRQTINGLMEDMSRDKLLDFYMHITGLYGMPLIKNQEPAKK